MSMQIIETDCTVEEIEDDMAELLIMHERAMKTELMWEYFGGWVTLSNGHKYQVAEFE